MPQDRASSPQDPKKALDAAKTLEDPKKSPDDPKKSLDQFFPPISTPDPSSYLEWSGVRQMTIVLAVICVAVVGFLAAWAWTLPDIADVQALSKTGSIDDPKIVADLLTQLRDEHSQRFRDMFQLSVVAVLVPLFTLLAGYVFGKSSREKGTE